MNGNALILAAHGSRNDPMANQVVRECAERISRLGSFHEVAVAFHEGEPTFATVLDGIEADAVTVVPLMSSAGYYSEVVLPRELAQNRRFGSVSVRITPPVGTHPGMVPLVARRVKELLEAYHLDPDAVTLVLVGHGSKRHERSKSATVDLADALNRLGLTAEVLTAFLEEDPRVDTILERAAHAAIVVEPFFFSEGVHTTRDIPAAMGLGGSTHVRPPLSGKVGDRFVVCDGAVGTDPGIIELIIDLARMQPDRPEPVIEARGAPQSSTARRRARRSGAGVGRPREEA